MLVIVLEAGLAVSCFGDGDDIPSRQDLNAFFILLISTSDFSLLTSHLSHSQ